MGASSHGIMTECRPPPARLLCICFKNQPWPDKPGKECGQRMSSFAGVDRDLHERELSPDQLIVELVQGWHYLFGRDPRVLRWIVEQQKLAFD
jgi:hypothetical protein